MRLILCLFLPVLILSCNNRKTETYQFRGRSRQGIYSEINLIKRWPENGPKEIWFVEGIGNGYGSPTVTESEIFVTGEKDSMAWLFCFDTYGQLQWKQKFGKEWSKHYPGSRSAPTVTKDLIYATTGMGILACLDRKTGEVVWTKDYAADFGGIFPLHGFSEAPVVFDDMVFCTPGGPIHNVLALNRYTGEIIWSCQGMCERMGYNPGNLIQIPGRTIYITFTAYNLLGIDACTGELLWNHPQDNTPLEDRKPGIGDTHSNCVLFDEGYIYYAAGDGNRGVKLQLSSDGTEIREVWRANDLDSFMGGIVKLGHFIYGCGTQKKDIKSFDAVTGEVTDSLSAGTGAVIAADNMLYYYNWGGELSLLGCNNGSLQKQGAFKIKRGSKEHFSHPVIKNGILYQRRGDVLMAFDIRAKV